MTASPQDATWLQQNSSLRMDANNSMFRESRRAFHIGRYEFAKSYCAGANVLDAACGTGYGSSLLATVAHSVVGIDLSQDAVDYAQRNYGSEKTTFQKSTVELTPFESSSFDVVVSFETLEHTIAPQATLQELARLVRGDGTVIASVPNAWGFTRNHFIDFDMPLLQQLTATFFDESEFFYNNSEDRSATMPAGIGPWEHGRPNHAECILAVCRCPKVQAASEHRVDDLLDQIYENAFGRHREFLELREQTALNQVTSGPLPKVRAGDTIVLQGTDFGQSAGRVELQFIGMAVQANIVSWKPQQLEIHLPAIAVTEPVRACLNVFLTDGHRATSSIVEFNPAAADQSKKAG